MKLSIQSPKQALKPFLKQKPLRSGIDAFKTNLISLLDKIKVIEQLPKDETEEHLKNDIRDFLRDTYYKDTNAINTKDKKDLVIHLGKTADTKVGVIIEAKRPSNKGEMITTDNANKKALHELVLYYLNERITNDNNELKQLVITNINEWYIIDANWFDKHIYRNTAIKKLYENKVAEKKDNPFFYEEVSKAIAKLDIEIPCVYFDITRYDKILRNDKKEDDRELIALYKILSPQHLLKIASPNDSNSLNDKFYKELLHIIGLEEVKEGGKNIIRRKKENRHAASLLETTIDAIATEDVLHRLPDASLYGATLPDRIFNVALELCITWMNRILFLKLLEGQLTSYHKTTKPPSGGEGGYRFLNTETINDFDELFKLFHKVLAINVNDRTEALKNKYAKVPYLNSSLFEISELEDHTIKINSLDNSGELEFLGNTVLKDLKKKAKKLPTLQYLFAFLDAYDFASEGKEDIQEESKDLINASVLGKIFEKINGYKDGSIFTPGFITMYMCRESIRQSVVQKFNEAIAPTGETMFDSYEDVKGYSLRHFKSEDILRLNKIVNSLKICDPAVGSGHFLVSALNEIIAIKAELGILADVKGNAIGVYEIEIVNDELVVNDIKHQQELTYEILEGKYPSSIQIQTLQKTLFHEKQQLIENCLFGVDINPNSVKICRLRLWIELLKNAYYKEETDYTQLETLPNIDINIKCGNSLLSRFALDADLTQSLKSIKYTVKEYREFVTKYKNERNRDAKRELQKIISGIKTDIVTQIRLSDPKKKRLDKLLYDLYYRFSGNMMFEDEAHYGKGKKKNANEEKKKIEAEVKTLETELEEVKANAIFKGAFEWRFEFPEVLDDEGKFLGFDVVIANPPYIRQEEFTSMKGYLQTNYKTFMGSADLYVYFVEKGLTLLKPNGHFTYILPNKWMKAGYGENLRSWIIQYEIDTIVDFGDLPVFDEATTYPSLLSIVNCKKENKLFNSAIIDTLNYPNGLDKYIIQKAFKVNKTLLSSKGGWTLVDDSTQNLLSKLKTLGKTLGDYVDDKIYYGIKTALNEAFLIDKETKDKLIEAYAESAEVIKPFLAGKNIKSYIEPIVDTWIILFPKGYTKKHISTAQYDTAWAWLKNQYPSISSHLLPFRNKAEERTDKGDYWWELRACDYYNAFENEKIVWPETSLNNQFCFVEAGVYLNKTTFIIPRKDNFLLGVLNSKLAYFYFGSIVSKMRGGYFSMSKAYVETLPIVHKEQESAEISILVDKILSAKEQNQDTTELERQIDVLVYQLYGLTEEDIKIVEGV